MKVSVVIPTHNRAKLVARAVNSVLEQTYQEFEIIVVSDGSTDDTDHIMEKFKKMDKRIKYVSYQKPKGANSARNTGIENAQFEYIAFLDDDDEWVPEKLEKQMRVFKSDGEIGLVYTGIYAIYVKEGLTYKNIPVSEGDLSKEILYKNLIGTTSTVVVKSSLLDKCGKFDVELKACQDYDLWIRICQVSKIGVVSSPCVKYYNYPGNNQISQQTEKYKEVIDIMFKKYQTLYNGLSEKNLVIVRKNNCMFLANNALRNANKKEGRKQLRKSLEFGFSFKSIIMYLFSFLNYKAILILRSWI